MASLFKSIGAPFIRDTEEGVAMALQSFNECQQKACLKMVGMNSTGINVFNFFVNQILYFFCSLYFNVKLLST